MDYGGDALAVAAVAVWVVVLIDVLRDPADFPNARGGRDDPNERLIWLFVVLPVGSIGALVYYFIVIKRYPRQQPAGASPVQAQPETRLEPEPSPQSDHTV